MPLQERGIVLSDVGLSVFDIGHRHGASLWTAPISAVHRPNRLDIFPQWVHGCIGEDCRRAMQHMCSFADEVLDHHWKLSPQTADGSAAMILAAAISPRFPW